MKRDNKLVFLTVVVTLFTILIFYLLIRYFKVLIENSGVVTFISLFVIIIIFIAERIIERLNKTKEELENLTILDYAIDHIINHLDGFEQNIESGFVNIFDLSELQFTFPPRLKGKSMRTINRTIWDCNDLVSTFNFQRNVLIDILTNPLIDDKLKMKKATDNWEKRMKKSLLDNTVRLRKKLLILKKRIGKIKNNSNT